MIYIRFIGLQISINFSTNFDNKYFIKFRHCICKSNIDDLAVAICNML